MGYAQDILVDCPHACVNRLRVRVEMSSQGSVLGVMFQGHEHTHDEWTGRPLEPEANAVRVLDTDKEAAALKRFRPLP